MRARTTQRILQICLGALLQAPRKKKPKRTCTRQFNSISKVSAKTAYRFRFRHPLPSTLWLAAPNEPHKLTKGRRAVGPAAEPPLGGSNCTAAWRAHIAPYEASVSRGARPAAGRPALWAAFCSLELSR